MELILLIMNCFIIITLFILIGIMIWPLRSKGNMTNCVIQLVLKTFLCAMHFSRLIVEISLGRSFYFTAIIMCIWILCTIMDANSIIKMNKKSEEEIDNQ